MVNIVLIERITHLENNKNINTPFVNKDLLTLYKLISLSSSFDFLTA
jgi:hypothetical protein